jgi:hypothetical protein
MYINGRYYYLTTYQQKNKDTNIVLQYLKLHSRMLILSNTWKKGHVVVFRCSGNPWLV